MTAHAVASLSARFGTEVPPVLWTPPDPRRTVAPGPAARDEPELDADEASALDVLAAPQVRIEARATGSWTPGCAWPGWGTSRRGSCAPRAPRPSTCRTATAPPTDWPRSSRPCWVGAARGSRCCGVLPGRGGAAALRAGDAGEIGAALRAIGVDADAARLIGRVFARSQRSVECTLYAGGNRCATVVAVIDSPAGRVVVRTANEPGAGEWISVAEGSPHRIGRALRRACEELPGAAGRRDRGRRAPTGRRPTVPARPAGGVVTWQGPRPNSRR